MPAPFDPATHFRFSSPEIQALRGAATDLAPLMSEIAAEPRQYGAFCGLEFSLGGGHWSYAVLEGNDKHIYSCRPDFHDAARFRTPAARLIEVGAERYRASSLGDMHRSFRCYVQPGLLVAWCPDAIAAIRTSPTQPPASALWHAATIESLRRTAESLEEDAILHDSTAEPTGHAAMRHAHIVRLMGGRARTARILKHAGFEPGAFRRGMLLQRIDAGAAVSYTCFNDFGDLTVGAPMAAIVLNETAP